MYPCEICQVPPEIGQMMSQLELTLAEALELDDELDDVELEEDELDDDELVELLDPLKRTKSTDTQPLRPL